MDTGETTAVFGSDIGLLEIENDGWRFGGSETAICTIHPNDPLSARVEQRFAKEFGREGLALTIDGCLKMSVTATHFLVTAEIVARENGDALYARDYKYKIPRDFV